MHEAILGSVSAARNFESSVYLPSTTNASTDHPHPSNSLPAFQHKLLLPSPPCSPPRPLVATKSTTDRSGSTSQTGTVASMLQASSTITTAKLDISLLLKSSPSPSPSLPGTEVPPGFGSVTSSVPPPSTQYPPFTTSQHRPLGLTSIASVRTGHVNRTAISSPSQVDFRATSSYEAQSQIQRPLLPPLTTTQLSRQSHAPLDYSNVYRSAKTEPRALPSPLKLATKRPPPSDPHPAASPAKRQSKWTPEEDALIIELRGGSMKWEEISKRLPGRSAISCRLHYQNYLERRSEWDEERKNRLARLYERLKADMWGPLAAELGIPWRAAEAMHWQLGESDMAKRAGVVPFTLTTSTSGGVPALLTHPAPTPVVTNTGHRYTSKAREPLGTSGSNYSLHELQQPESHHVHVDGTGTLGERLQGGSLAEIATSVRRTAVAPLGISPGQVFLPSLAELEHGLTPFDNPTRNSSISNSRDPWRTRGKHNDSRG